MTPLTIDDLGLEAETIAHFRGLQVDRQVELIGILASLLPLKALENRSYSDYQVYRFTSRQPYTNHARQMVQVTFPDPTPTHPDIPTCRSVAPPTTLPNA